MSGIGDLLSFNILPPSERSRVDKTASLVQTLNTLAKDYHDRRQDRRDRMLECWSAYLGTPTAERWRRATAMKQTLGDVNVDWRHKINRGKAYEIVETIVPYFVSAAFPNDDWFDMEPDEPIMDEDLDLFVKLITAFMSGKLQDCKFQDVFEIAVRQACIVGYSPISLPWRTETKKSKRNVKIRLHDTESYLIEEQTVEKVIYNAPDMAVEDAFDYYFDPDGIDPNTANMVRRLQLTRGEVLRLVQDGAYPDADETDVWKLRPIRYGNNDERREIQDFMGILEHSTSDVLELFEFWGCCTTKEEEYYDIVATWSNNTLLRVENNPYWGGRPFVILTYTQIPGTPYPLGVLEPVLGDLHEIDVVSNQRLDGLEVSLQPTMLAINDGTVDFEQVSVEPGKVIPVGSLESIRPLNQDLRFASVSMTEEKDRETTIDRRTGTTSFVGTAPGRSGDRVTKAEIEAVKSAGGNRLSGVYDHIERTTLLPLLERLYTYCQQFVTQDEIVKVRNAREKDDTIWATVGVDQLAYQFKVRPKGSAHIANKEYELNQLLQLITVGGSNPMIAQNLNWAEITRELVRRFTPDHPDRFYVDAEAQQAPASDMEQVGQQAEAVGGTDLKDALATQMQADGGESFMQGQAAAGVPMPQPMQPPL